MKNYVAEGRVMQMIAPYALAAGQGALVGSMFGVAVTDIGNGLEGDFMAEGIVDLTKIASQGWSQGALIYWDNANRWCTNVASTHKLIGVAYIAVGSGASDLIGRVRLNGGAVN